MTTITTGTMAVMEEDAEEVVTIITMVEVTVAVAITIETISTHAPTDLGDATAGAAEFVHTGEGIVLIANQVTVLKQHFRTGWEVAPMEYLAPDFWEERISKIG